MVERLKNENMQKEQFSEYFEQSGQAGAAIL